MSVTFKKVEDYIPLQEIPEQDFSSKLYGYKQFQTLYNPNLNEELEEKIEQVQARIESLSTEKQKAAANKTLQKLISDKEKNDSYKSKLYPLFIRGEDENGKLDGVKVGVWYRCGQGTLKVAFDKETGLPKTTKDKERGILISSVFTPDDFPSEQDFEEYKDKLAAVKVDAIGAGGALSFRPGWHLGSSPVTRHIGTKDSLTPAYKDYNKTEPVFNADGTSQKSDYDMGYSQNVWAMVEYSTEHNFTKESLDPKYGGNGIPNFRKDDKYRNSFYKFQTNANANSDETWIIADAIKIVKILTDKEVEEIAKGHGLRAQKRHAADGSANNKFTVDFSQFDMEKIFETVLKSM